MLLYKIMLAFFIGGIVGLAFGLSEAYEPQMNTICDKFHSQTKYVDSIVNGKVIPLEITEYVCDEFHMEGK